MPTAEWRRWQLWIISRYSKIAYERDPTRWKRYEKPLLGHRVQVGVKSSSPSAAHGASTTS